MKVDTTLNGNNNRELFVGRCFFDAASKNCVYIDTNSIARLQLQHAWIASAGKITGAAGSAGYSAGNIENGAGLVVKSQGPINCSMSGCSIYNSAGSGAVIYSGNWTIGGGTMVDANGTGSGGGDGIDIEGNGDFNVSNALFTQNGSAAVGYAINMGVQAALIVQDCDFNGAVQGTVSNLNAASGSQFVGHNLFGPPETRTQATTSYGAPSIAGVYTGYNTTPRLLLSTGNAAQNWEQDNSGGVWRAFSGGTAWWQMSTTDVQLLLPFDGNLAAASVPTTFGGVLLGQISGSGRIVIGNGNSSQAWGVDNNGGVLRFFQNGQVLMTLDGSGNLKTHGTVTPSAF